MHAFYRWDPDARWPACCVAVLAAAAGRVPEQEGTNGGSGWTAERASSSWLRPRGPQVGVGAVSEGDRQNT